MTHSRFPLWKRFLPIALVLAPILIVGTMVIVWYLNMQSQAEYAVPPMAP